MLLLLEEPAVGTRIHPGEIAVDANSIDNATPIHKLFHAATEADCPSSVRKQCIDESHAAAVETWDPSWAGPASSWHFGLIDGDPVWRNRELPLKLSSLPVAEPDFEQLGSLAIPKFSKSLSAIDMDPGISERFNLY